jgi:ubiquitin C-terminal hydrolase
MEKNKHLKLKYYNNISNGLSNLGNTCFFNSILQLLYQCTMLNKLILSNNFTGPLISYYSNYLESYLNSESSYFSPDDIVKYISDILGRKGFQQEDAEQYLSYIIDCLINELKEFTDKELIGNNNISNKNISLDELIDFLFTLKIKKTLKCPICLNCSESNDDINKLYLCIESYEQNQEQDLKNLINKYLLETLDCENKWKCDKCNEYIQATISRQIIKLPKYLIIVLKRYDNLNRKNNTIINMLDNLDINTKLYNLRGIVYHSGSTLGGHYVYYGNKHDLTNKWYLYNDSSVSQIDDNTISNIKKYGYIYLYVKK